MRGPKLAKTSKHNSLSSSSSSRHTHRQGAGRGFLMHPPPQQGTFFVSFSRSVARFFLYATVHRAFFFSTKPFCSEWLPVAEACANRARRVDARSGRGQLRRIPEASSTLLTSDFSVSMSATLRFRHSTLDMSAAAPHQLFVGDLLTTVLRSSGAA